MGILNWLSGAAKTVGAGLYKGMDWIGQKVVRPAADFLKKIPIVGDVVRAADPLGNLVAKNVGATSDALNNVDPSKRRKIASFSETVDGIKAIPKVISAGTSAVGRVGAMASQFA